jgi:hypothetical protein
MEKILLYSKEFEKLRADTQNYSQVILMDGSIWLNKFGSDIWFGNCGYDQDLPNGN